MRLAPSLQAACERWPERPAITFRSRTLSYAELGRLVGNVAASYREIGIGPGDRVVCALPDRPEHVVAIGAAWACGAIHVGTDADLTGGELAWLAARTGAAALVLLERLGGDDRIAAVRAASPATRLVVHGDGDPASGAGAADEVLRFASLTGDRGGAPVPPPFAFTDDDTALLLLTSGTTGRPKAIMESQPHCWAKMQFFADAFRPGPDDVHLVYLPIGHVFGLRLALIALLSGGRLVLLDRFSPDEALRLVTDEKVTVLPGMPTHLRLIVDRLDPARHDVSSLRWAISAAATLPRPLAEQVYERLAPDLLFVYGCSEGFTTLTTDRQEILAGSVGRTVFAGPPGTAPAGTVEVAGPDGCPLPAGQIGEILFAARQPVRYWHDPPVATDGWYHTGDLGRLDGEGRLYLEGRLKELVNRGGLKVSPGEIETVLCRHPAVSDAAIVGTPDPVLGEAICACIVASGSPAPSLEEVRSFLGSSLARHKLPDELCVLDRIPRTNIGKVERAALVRMIVGGQLVGERARPR
jgi:acyl-CoA synthetase (AMP-forming)/AMP-acid ligase II